MAPSAKHLSGQVSPHALRQQSALVATPLRIERNGAKPVARNANLQTRAVVADKPPAMTQTPSSSKEKIKIGINGFGRIGRLVARCA